MGASVSPVPRHRRLLGRAPDEIVGRALPAALVHPDDLDAVQAALMESSYFGRAGAAEVRLRHQRRTLCLGGNTLPSGADSSLGAPAEIVAVTRDISERKAQERALVEARDAALGASRAKSPSWPI